MSKHLVLVGRENSLFKGRNFRQNQAPGGRAMCHDWLGVDRKEKRRKRRENRALGETQTYLINECCSSL